MIAIKASVGLDAEFGRKMTNGAIQHEVQREVVNTFNAQNFPIVHLIWIVLEHVEHNIVRKTPNNFDFLPLLIG